MAVDADAMADVEQLAELGVGREGDVPQVERSVLVLRDHGDQVGDVVALGEGHQLLL